MEDVCIMEGQFLLMIRSIISQVDFIPGIMLKQLVGKIQTVTGLGNHLEAILYCLELFGSIIRL